MPISSIFILGSEALVDLEVELKALCSTTASTPGSSAVSPQMAEIGDRDGHMLTAAARLQLMGSRF